MKLKEGLNFIKNNFTRLFNIWIIFFLVPILVGTLITEAFIALAYAKVFTFGESLLYISFIVNLIIGILVLSIITLGIFILSHLLINHRDFKNINYVKYIKSNKKQIRQCSLLLIVFLLSWIGSIMVIDSFIKGKMQILFLVVVAIIFTYGIHIILSLISNKVFLKSGHEIKEKKKKNFFSIGMLFLVILNLFINFLFFKFYAVPIINGAILILFTIIFILNLSGIIFEKNYDF
ncbi:MAG: hypothetical protein ACRDD2_10425 [Sarcina sp.]